MKNTYYINGVEFKIIKEDKAEIQVGDNWGNRIKVSVEEARIVYKAIKEGTIQVHESSLGTFETIGEIRDLLDNQK